MSEPVDIYSDEHGRAFIEIIELGTDKIPCLVIDDDGTYSNLHCEINPTTAREIAKGLIEWADKQQNKKAMPI